MYGWMMGGGGVWWVLWTLVPLLLLSLIHI